MEFKEFKERVGSDVWVCPKCGHKEFIMLLGSNVVQMRFRESGKPDAGGFIHNIRELPWNGFGCLNCRTLLGEMDLVEETVWLRSKHKLP